MNRHPSILITGASTGIGRECTLELSKQGYKIYAGVRKQEDFDALNSIGSEYIYPIILDVCKEDDTQEAFKILSKDNDCPLFGLINNAGIGISGMIEVTPVEELIKLFEVNIIGLHRVTKAMLPLIRKSKGRIINIGSSSSFFSGPGLGIYASSKFAVRAYNDSLRMEMKSHGVKVSLVAPGPIESEIWDKSKAYKEYLRSKTDPELLKTYEMFVKAGDKILDKIKPIPAIHVVKAVLHGLTAKKPKYVYMVNARAARFISRIPKKWSDYLILKEIQKTANN
jgi:short-subunit dehydrogenase